MIFQWILTIGLLFCLLYALLQRKKSRLVSRLIAATSIAGVAFVMFPEFTTELAHYLGIGRGADLIMYCWIMISLTVSVSLQFKILQLQEVATELARALAIHAATQPTQNEPSERISN